MQCNVMVKTDDHNRLIEPRKFDILNVVLSLVLQKIIIIDKIKISLVFAHVLEGPCPCKSSPCPSGYDPCP